MRTFSPAEMLKFREIISGFVQALTETHDAEKKFEETFKLPEKVVPLEPPTLTSRFMTFFAGKKAPVVLPPTVVTIPEASNAPNSAKADRCVSMLSTDPYSLVRFLTELNSEPTILMTRQMKAIAGLNDSALLFFVQCERANSNTLQAEVDKDAKAKIALMREKRIRWEDIVAIDSIDHPLLNARVIQRMHNMHTTLMGEVRFMALQKPFESLLGDIYLAVPRAHFSRINNSVSVVNVENKTEKFNEWLIDAQCSFDAQTALGKYSFYKQHRVEVGKKKTRKSITDVVGQRRNSLLDSIFGGEPTSLHEINTLTILLDKIQEIIQSPIPGKFTHFLNELELGAMLLKIPDSEEKLSKINYFFQDSKNFRLEYVSSGSDHVFKSSLLKLMVRAWLMTQENKTEACRVLMDNVVTASQQDKMPTPEITWRAIQVCIDDYHQKKNTGSPVSKVIGPLEECISARAKTVDTELSVNDKVRLMVIIYERYHQSDVLNTDDPLKIKKSQQTCSSIINLLYGVDDSDDMLMHVLMQTATVAELICRIQVDFTPRLTIALKGIQIPGVDTSLEASLKELKEETQSELAAFMAPASSATAQSAVSSHNCITLAVDQALLLSLENAVKTIK